VRSPIDQCDGTSLPCCGVGERAPDRLGFFEVLGAWLGLWTPPRGVVVPPVPWRKIAVGTAVLVVALGTAGAILIPDVVEDREAAAERERRAEAERHAAFLASVDREQRPRRGRGEADPGRGAPEGRRLAARSALLGSAEAAIARDAGTRTTKPIRGMECSPFPRTLDETDPATELSRPAASYQCVAVTSRFGERSDVANRGVIGMPFRLVLHFDRGRFAFCRIVPLGDRDRLSHPLPDACRLSGPQ
jgi:hypothetical protein